MGLSNNGQSSGDWGILKLSVWTGSRVKPGGTVGQSKNGVVARDNCASATCCLRVQAAHRNYCSGSRRPRDEWSAKLELPVYFVILSSQFRHDHPCLSRTFSNSYPTRSQASGLLSKCARKAISRDCFKLFVNADTSASLVDRILAIRSFVNIPSTASEMSRMAECLGLPSRAPPLTPVRSSLRRML